MAVILFSSKWTVRNCTITGRGPWSTVATPPVIAFSGFFTWSQCMPQHPISGPFEDPRVRGVVLVKPWAASGSVLAFDHQEMHVSECSSKNDSALHCVAYRDHSPLLGAHGVQQFATLIKGKHIRLWQVTLEAERCQLERVHASTYTACIKSYLSLQREKLLIHFRRPFGAFWCPCAQHHCWVTFSFPNVVLLLLEREKRWATAMLCLGARDLGLRR